MPTLCYAKKNVILSWSPNKDPIVAGFNIYYGGISGVYTNKTSISVTASTSLNISNLLMGNTYYFAASTYSDAGAESALSSEISYTVPMPMPLSVQVFGHGVPNPKWGWLSGGFTSTSIWIPGYGIYTTSTWAPGYTNGTLLDVNENYTLTAVANPGFAFANWSDGNGNVLTNGPTLCFTMTTNLALVANFIDVQKPTLSIVSPTPNQQVTNGPFTATGKANDNVSIASVFYSLNGSPWTNATTANNWTNWSAALALTPGNNTLQAYAVDTSGNLSATNTVSFECTMQIISSAISSSVEPITIGAPAVLSPASFTSDQFALEVSGTTNSQYVVQASTDLVNWISVQTNKAPFTFVDTNASQFNQRFYRTVSVQ